MPRKRKGSRRSYSRRESDDDSYSDDSRFSRDDSLGQHHSSSRSRDRHHASRSRDDRYYREGSRSRDDRYYREGSRSRDDRHPPRDRRSSRDERYNREYSRDRSYKDYYSDDDDDDYDENRRNSSGSRRFNYEKSRSSSYSYNSDDEDHDRNERSRVRNEERRARKAGRRPKREKSKRKLGPSRGGVESNLAVQKRRNNNHYKNLNMTTIGDNVKLKKKLEEEGLSIVDMTSDGNCLFRSVSDQLYNDRGHHHDEVRSDICDFMAENEDDFKMFLVIEGDGKNKGTQDASDFESYIADTRRDGVWGGNLELVAAARLYRRNITVYSATLSVFTIECDCEDTSGPDMLLSFHSGDHYNSVRANAGNKKYSRNGRKLTRNGSGGSSRRSLTDTVTTAASTVSTPPATAEFGLQDTNIVLATVVGIDDVPVNKNAQCPCGSGKRYKRCCWANVKEEKKEARKRKDKRNRGNSPIQVARTTEEESISSGFKVLQI